MKFFIDTADVEAIRKANDMGIICGVTTNPSLIAKEGRDFNEVIKEITTIVDGPISGEVKATTVDAETMIEEAKAIAAIHPNMVVKIPMTAEGLKATKACKKMGIKTNVTLIFSAAQALLAARAGATYVSPFLGRLDDISMPGIDLIQSIADIFALHGIETEIIAARAGASYVSPFVGRMDDIANDGAGLVAEIEEIFDIFGIETEIIAASVRNPIHVIDCAAAGADIATVPYNVLMQMINHPLTTQGIEKFKKDYIAVFGE